MARYEHLPLYKKAMETALYFEDTVREFSRYHKYTLGSELRDLSRQVVLLIIRANNSDNKKDTLQELVITCEMLKTSVVLAKEVKAFKNFKAFQKASNLAVNLCRQSEGWLKNSK